MERGRRKEFGRRGAAAPPILTNAPNGLAGGAAGPSRRRKRSLGVGLVSIGALSLGGFALFEALDRKVKCPPDQNDWEQQECSESSSRGGSSSRSSSSSHGSSSSGSSATSHGVSFGGFGATGSGHGGGGG